MTQTLKSNVFSLKEKIDFYKKKWLKEHIAIMVAIGVIIIVIFASGIIFQKFLLEYLAIFMLVIARAWRNNAMMAYVEKNAYDSSGKK